LKKIRPNNKTKKTTEFMPYNTKNKIREIFLLNRKSKIVNKNIIDIEMPAKRIEK